MLRLIRVYTVKENELYVNDVKSQQELNAVVGKVERAWVDCWDCDDDETMIISKLIGVEATTLDGIENGKVRPSYAKCRDEECPYYTWISTPVVEFAGELKLHPLSIILRERFLITLRTGYSSRIIDSAIQRFKTMRPEERKPSVTLVGLLAEIIDENSLAMVSIRDLIDKIEEALNSIRPYLQADGGDVALVSVDDDGVVKVKLQGACGACPMSQMTLTMGIERALKQHVPEVKQVV